jgi:uncharacterized protein YcbK (DUF882 family)
MLFGFLPVMASMTLGTAQPHLAPQSETVPVALYDENHYEFAIVQIGRDGSVSPEADRELRHLFRCKNTGLEHKMDPRLLAMLADVSSHFDGKVITFVSGYRTGGTERMTSPHRGARALDFRINGVSLVAVRDYMWKYYDEVGIGWYPNENFVHMDHRPGQSDIAWTFLHGVEHYNPGWAERVRGTELPKVPDHQAGL